MTETRTMSDLIAFVSDSDVNVMSAADYRRYRSQILAYYSIEDLSTFYATGQLPIPTPVEVASIPAVEDYSVSDLVHAITGDDVNGMDASEYRRARYSAFAITTAEERAIFFATGEVPARFIPEQQKGV